MKWKIAKKISDDFVKKFPGLAPEILQLLANRDINNRNSIDKFFNPEYADLPDPFLFVDMKRLVERIKEARDKQETVFVYGDYDTDGVSSSIIMGETLRAIGLRNVGVYIPHREREGYGLNDEALDYIKQQGGTLLITVDCGTSNAPQVVYARSIGIEVVILDHHEEPRT